MLWSREERAFAVEAYFSNRHSVIAVQRAFRRHFEIPPRGRVPDRKSILLWVDAFRETGNVSKRKKGPTRTVTTPENVERVRQSMLRSPKRSARKHAVALGMSGRSVRRILHDELHLHPYKMISVQQLTERDYVTRQTSCEQLVDTLPNDALVFFSDEAHFNLSGCVNKQNMRYWSETNPRELHESPLHSDRVTVWCAISRVGIIGPYFFQENGRALTVNSDRYLTMLQEFFLPALEEMELDNVWFQQDGATAHTARISMDFLREAFPGRLISLRGDVNWPARSPDLAPCDYFLWGYLKSLVYNDRPQTLEDLQNNIRTEIANIPVNMLERVDQNFRNRLNQCIDNGGRHLKDILFKTV
jgi:transposase-like protein